VISGLHLACLQMLFQDDGPFLLITQSSFDDLSRRLVDRDVREHVTLEHFRPTITISGHSPPFDEVKVEKFLVDRRLTSDNLTVKL